MIFKEQNFIPILLGSDINTYSMARAFYEAYQVKTIVMGKFPTGPSYKSKITEFYAIPKLDQEGTFLEKVNEMAEKYKDKKVILLGCGDNYVAQIITHKQGLRENVIAPYISEELMTPLINKETFYKVCDEQGMAYPNTFVHTPTMALEVQLPFEFPVILKPADSVSYWEHPFETQKKVYKIKTQEELQQTIQEIYGSGYTESLIIQDFIPGDDSYMRVMTCFSGKDKKVKLMSLGHVILEEHTPHGLGNHAVIINEYDEALSLKIKNFLEAIEYEGFSNFDIKYDQRDDTYKVFEINIRQGRSNFYVTGAGANLAKCLVETYIEGKELTFSILKNEHLWSVIPIAVAVKYANKQWVGPIKALKSSGKFVNPVFFKGDNNLVRRLRLLRSHFSHFKKYKLYY